MSQSAFGDINNTSSVDNSSQTTACILCRRIFSADNEGGELEAIDMCMDCKFLFLEDPGTPIRDVYQRRQRLRRRQRPRGTSSESIENLFSQHFSQMIGLARTNQALLVEPDNQSLNGDNTTRISQHMSSNTTPSGSRRWRRVLSDTESDGMSSLYGESVPNASYAGYRSFHGDSDTLSYSAYGGESDASVDGYSVMEIDDFGIPDGGSDFETDTDIDPMHAGLYQWNSDDHEGDEYEEDTEWEDGNVEGNAIDSWRLGTSLRRSMSPYGRRPAVNFHQTITFLESGNTTNLMIPERRRAENTNISARGAPPAAVSFVKNLPRFIFDRENEDSDDLACAICKDSIHAGAVVNQLPCSHIYHPSCITPWLSERNSCPLCRFELPTDDKDYENRKQTSSSRGPDNIWQQELARSSSSDLSDGAADADEPHGTGNSITIQSDHPSMNGTAESSERSRGRSIFHRVVSSPLVSVVGIAIVLWLRNSISSRRLSSDFPVHDQRHLNSNLGSHSSNQRVMDGRRRWWSLF
ncbi:ubiquitin-protein ligase [Lithospermum erythrorhizon]|uniref:RING-type E3 ubiquitin transferase n=1 Tax=Lithospermum erythrorhizon TaxID=34254 RepID=A0AAV3P9C4_LITER